MQVRQQVGRSSAAHLFSALRKQALKDIENSGQMWYNRKQRKVLRAGLPTAASFAGISTDKISWK